MKTTTDRQTCQILNKIATMIDSIKQHSGKVNPVIKYWMIQQCLKVIILQQTPVAVPRQLSISTKRDINPENQNQKMTKNPHKSINQRIPTKRTTERPMQYTAQLRTCYLNKSP